MLVAHVKIHEASALAAKNGKCNPYAVVLFNYGEREETDKKKNERNPKWDKLFLCNIRRDKGPRVIDVQVFSDHDFLGQVSFFFDCAIPLGSYWYPLGSLPGAADRISQGKICISITIGGIKQASFSPTFVPTAVGLPALRGWSAKKQDRPEMIIVQLGPTLCGFPPQKAYSTKPPLFSIDFESIKRLKSKTEDTYITITIVYTTQENKSEQEVNILCETTEIGRYFFNGIQLWRRRILEKKHLPIPFELQGTFTMQPFPFDDFTISNFHMQSEEEITIVRRTMSRQADNKQEESLQQNLTLTETLPKNKSVLTGFQFSPEEICNSYDWSLSTIDRESMSLIERSYTNYSTLEINKEVQEILSAKSNTKSISSAVYALSKSPRAFIHAANQMRGSRSSQQAMSTLMYSGEDHSPFGCKAPSGGDEYNTKIISQMRKRIFGGNSETVHVHKNGNVTYRGLSIDTKNPYDAAYLCPPPPLLELFVPLGVGDGQYESSLKQDPFIKENPPPSLIPIKDIFLSVDNCDDRTVQSITPSLPPGTQRTYGNFVKPIQPCRTNQRRLKPPPKANQNSNDTISKIPAPPSFPPNIANRTKDESAVQQILLKTNEQDARKKSATSCHILLRTSEQDALKKTATSQNLFPSKKETPSIENIPKDFPQNLKPEEDRIEENSAKDTSLSKTSN